MTKTEISDPQVLRFSFNYQGLYLCLATRLEERVPFLRTEALQLCLHPWDHLLKDMWAPTHIHSQWSIQQSGWVYKIYNKLLWDARLPSPERINLKTIASVQFQTLDPSNLTHMLSKQNLLLIWYRNAPGKWLSGSKKEKLCHCPSLTPCK